MQNPFGGRLSDMSNTENPPPNLHNYVLQQMKAGADKSTIVRSVVDRGMDSTEASRAVDIEYRRIAERVQRETVTPGAIQTALLGGLLAAAGGGAIWGLIAIHSKQELGIIALGIGFLAGYLVVWLSGGRKGISLQVIASVSALLGILVGKYLAFFHAFKQELIREIGTDAAGNLSPLSADALRIFFEKLPDMVSPYDILWIVLAFGAAWSIPKGLGITLPPGYISPYMTKF